MTEALDRLRAAVAKKQGPPPLTPFVGTGFSLAATGGADHASWRGLLLEGIKVCRRVGAPMPTGWPDRMREQLDNADVYTYLAVADEITRRLRSVRGGIEVASWLESTVGRLEATEEGKRIVGAVCKLSKVILTTNYDTIIEKATKKKWKTYTWNRPGYGSPPSTSGAVLHLHGIADDVESIILGSADYQRLSQDELANVFNKSLFASRRFVFIGCGEGLNDPNISVLTEFADRVLNEKTEHYLLVPGDQLRQFNEHPISRRIVPVAYGGSFDKLTPFLQNLVGDLEIDAIQDPDYYDALSAARPRTALLDLAGPAWEKLQAVREALWRAVRRMEQVENRGAAPDRMTQWDLRDQKSVHEQLAASIRGPATHLESCLVEVVAGIKDADHDVGRLAAPPFTKFAADLEQISGTVSEMESQAWQLRDRVAAAKDDLEERTGRYSGYRLPHDTLIRAHRYAEEAHTLVSSLKEVLDQIQAGTAAGVPEREPDLATPGAEPAKPDLRIVPDMADVSPDEASPEEVAGLELPPAGEVPAAEPDENTWAGFRRVPLLWEIKAGGLTLSDEQNIRDYLALPAQYVHGEQIYLLEVSGDSMTGEAGVLEGDYVVVDAEAAWNNGDMAVVFVEHEGATLKRIWHEGTSIVLQPSNPAYESIHLGPGEEPDYQGKVIGVVRWQISAGRRRRPP